MTKTTIYPALSLILGVVGLIVPITPIVPVLGVPQVFAVLFGVLGVRQRSRRALSISGIALGLVGMAGDLYILLALR